MGPSFGQRVEKVKRATTRAITNGAIGLEKWFCICDDLANPKIGLNLVPNYL